MTASSIAAANGPTYARYLESKTVVPDRGDYYLTRDGEPAQAPGRWLTSPPVLAQLGIENDSVDGSDFIALLEGRHPRQPGWLRSAGASGVRGGGIDLTFSAPKSVSVVWALGGRRRRLDMEEAHEAAVRSAVEYLRGNVATVRRRVAGQVVEETAQDLLAAEYRHTVARGVLAGDAPDPQMHSHMVITSAIRRDGRVVAVASRPVFRAARELGAYYRLALASELTMRGYAIEAGTGRHGRYFEIAGLPEGLAAAFSRRSREVARAAERFRARWGREPARGDLRRLKLQNRQAKVLRTSGDLQRTWNELGGGFDVSPQTLGRMLERGVSSPREGALGDRVERRLTERAATFRQGEFRATVFEQSVGELRPSESLGVADGLIAERRVLVLDGGAMTTRTVRTMERSIEERLSALAAAGDRNVGERACRNACREVGERIGVDLSGQQRAALSVITGRPLAAVLIGPAGTGKGVVIDAAARAEQLSGHDTIGIAVSGSTAQRLGRDSPALLGSTLTLDALIARVATGRIHVGATTTVYFDEAGMADTARLDVLTDLVRRAGAKLVLVGDAEQLPSIGAGGMFERLAKLVPTAELATVHRTLDRDERRAWADLRAGRSDRAIAHYRAAGRLHLADTRDEALERAVADWARITETHHIREVALISDASNNEIARLNARAQHYRLNRGELGDVELEIPGVHYGLRAGDRIAMVDQHREPGKRRIENGSQGTVLDISERAEAIVEFDVTGDRRTLVGEDLARIRLGYAQHIHRAQGATVTRALVVTGGWQTSKEPTYVEASRAREGTDWYVNRHELGEEGHDADRIARFAASMRRSRRQVPSVLRAEASADRDDLLPRRDRPRQRPAPTRPAHERTR